MTPQAGVFPPWPVPLYGSSRECEVVEETLELATFRGDDDPSLVAAALACRACLSGDVEYALQVDDFDGQVEVRCRACGYVRTVSLTSEQALRLSLQGA
jgi:uncharacterized Zn finger protein